MDGTARWIEVSNDRWHGLVQARPGQFWWLQAGFLVCVLLIPGTAVAVFDQDGDGVTDAYDNCTLVYNTSQYDSNGDGIGNVCDQDITNDGIVDSADEKLFKSLRKTRNPDLDFNEDGRVRGNDLEILQGQFGLAPGPSGTMAPVYERPRILTTGSQLVSLSSKLGQYPYSKFWQAVEVRAIGATSTIPPCPVYSPGCGAPDNITDYDDNTIRALGERIPNMAIAYRLTGDNIYLNGVRTWMDAMVSYQDWASNEDLGAAHILIGMSIAYDWLHDQFTQSEQEVYREKMRHHAEILYDLLVNNAVWWADETLQNHNYTNTAAIALTAIALYGEVPEADDWLYAAITNFETVLLHISPDGASHEGVAYWSYGMHSMLKYFLAMERFLPEVGDALRGSSYFQNAALYRLHASLPDYSGHVNYADTQGNDYNGPGYILRVLAREFDDGYAQWLAERIEDARGTQAKLHWLDLLWYSPAVTAISPDALPPYHYFDNMGLLISRSSWSDDAFLSFHKSGPPQGYHAASLGVTAGSHIQPDEGQFLAWSQGDWLLQDPGYTKPKLTEQHNVLLFNNTGQLGADGDWFVRSEVESQGGTVMPVYSMVTDIGQYVVTDVAPMYRNAADVLSWERSFISLPEGYQIIRDDVQLNGPGTIKSLVHASPAAAAIDSSSVVLNPAMYMMEAFDRTGAGHDGNITGCEMNTDSVSGMALKLMSSSDAVEIPSLHGNNFPGSGSLSLWIRASDYAGQNNKGLFDRYDGSRDHLFIRATAGSVNSPISGVQVAFQPGDGSSYRFIRNIDLSHDEWHHLVVTWDTGSDWGQIYLHGCLLAR